MKQKVKVFVFSVLISAMKAMKLKVNVNVFESYPPCHSVQFYIVYSADEELGPGPGRGHTDLVSAGHSAGHLPRQTAGVHSHGMLSLQHSQVIVLW